MKLYRTYLHYGNCDEKGSQLRYRSTLPGNDANTCPVRRAILRLLREDKLEQPGGPRAPYFLAGSSPDSPDIELRETSTEPEYGSSAETVARTPLKPNTGEEYQIELPATPVVKEALLDFDYPASGIEIKDISEVLADQFALTNEERNARYKYGLVW